MKKPYKKPEIKKVKLNPEEAVLAGCKAQNVAPAGPWYAGNCGTFMGNKCKLYGT